LEVERNTKETGDFKNIVRATGANSTQKNYETPNPIYAAALNGSVGPAKMLTVGNGDKITMSANAYYNQAVSGSSATGAVLAAAVTSAFGLNSGEAAQVALNNNLPGAFASFGPNPSAPKAFIFYYLFSTDFTTWSQFGYKEVTTAASAGFENVNLPPVTVSLPTGVTQAYMYIYVANQTTGTTVYFDDVSIVHEKNNYTLQVNQANDYYPFGLTISPLSYQKQLTTLATNKNKYKFQGQEAQDELGLGWYQFKYRMHDPAIGRFGGVDPLAEKFMYNSPYAFSENRLIDGVELEGLEYAPVNTDQIVAWEFMAPQQQLETLIAGYNKKVTSPVNFVVFPYEYTTNDVNVVYGGESRVDYAEFIKNEMTIYMYDIALKDYNQGISILLHESDHKVSSNANLFPNSDENIVMPGKEIEFDGIKTREMLILPGADLSRDEIHAYKTQLIGDFSGLVDRQWSAIEESIYQMFQYIKNLNFAMMYQTNDEKK
jgi:RHS repeat-associated protein